ncbi:hypothetical protein ACFPES_33365 [Paenibacillus sp. GCM10023248]|uniref:hypothetical protein n=1 Tax=Bacillales TaxID=1385 RepID=UPI002379C3E8|nr:MULTISPECIES: hypothetical protein [Bacillales]MDD9271927.1 hypothetical protein [Paenibacillus sp. MAHUQ-63]
MSVFWVFTIATLLIVWVEWSKLKQKPLWDRAVFVALLLAVWLLSMLDLPHTPGPPTLLQAIFKPFKPLVEH